MDKDINKSLPQATFQSMVTGENVPIAIKYKTAKGEIWDVPLAGASNHIPNYKDTHGQISRRVVLIPYATRVPEEKRNVSLSKQILEGDELVTVFVRCIRKYKETRAKYGSKGFWSFAPETLQLSKENLRQCADHLANFIANGDDFYDIIQDEDSTTMLVDLEKAYSNHMQFTQKMHNQKIGVERDAIANAGFKEQLTKMCKLCSRPALQKYAITCTYKGTDGTDICGTVLHGRKNNRKEVIAFTNMRLQKKPRLVANTSTTTIIQQKNNNTEQIYYSENTAAEEMIQHKELTSMRTSLSSNQNDIRKHNHYGTQNTPSNQNETMEQKHDRLMGWRNEYIE